MKWVAGREPDQNCDPRPQNLCWNPVVLVIILNIFNHEIIYVTKMCQSVVGYNSDFEIRLFDFVCILPLQVAI